MSNFKFPCFECEDDTDCVFISYSMDMQVKDLFIENIPQSSIMCLHCGQTFDSPATMDNNLDIARDMYNKQKEQEESLHIENREGKQVITGKVPIQPGMKIFHDGKHVGEVLSYHPSESYEPYVMYLQSPLSFVSDDCKLSFSVDLKEPLK